MLVVHSCAHCTSVETEALGKQEVLGLVFGCGIVARGQEVMGSGMGRGRPSAKGAGSRLSTGQSTAPPPQDSACGGGGAVETVFIPHPFSSSALWGCSVKRLLSIHLINIHNQALFI